jgi:ParB-like chromosome segregation protein Spo0J
VKTLNLLNIRIDGGTQAREELNQEAVADYAEKMRDGEVFPPVTVFFDGSEYWLVDGFHRYFATKSNGKTSIDAEVENGTLKEAVRASWKANGKRGLNLNSADTKKIMLAMFADEVTKTWSNRQIAEYVGVSHSTVNRLKSLLEQRSTEKKPVKDSGDKPVSKADIGKTIQKISAPDMTSALMVKQEVVLELNEKIDELSQTINMLADENTVMRDKIAVGQWDASEIEKIDAEQTIKDLREQIRILEADNKAMRQSRDMFQNRNSELMKTVKSLQSKLKKLDPQ